MTIAYWCVFIAAFLPFLFTGIAKFTGPGFNNYKPRDFLDKLDGARKRAHWAQLNSFEAFPAFAAAIIIAQFIAKIPQDTINTLAMAFVGFRLIYGALYITNKASLRTLAWTGASACTAALFIMSA